MKTLKGYVTWLVIALLGGLVFGSILGGCAQGFNEVDEFRVVEAPAQAEAAIAIIIDELNIAHEPSVYWYGRDMDCDDGNGWQHEGMCIDGIFIPYADQIMVSVKNGANVSKTALTHEFCHQSQFESTGDADYDHKSDCFKTRLAQINERIANELK